MTGGIRCIAGTTLLCYNDAITENQSAGTEESV